MSDDNTLDTSKVNRVEVITWQGRGYTNYTASNVSVHLQDAGRTLKVFIDGFGKPDLEDTE